jgi:hypothetical protein
MTLEEFEKQRMNLLNKKIEVDTRLAAIKDIISQAHRDHAPTGQRSNVQWLNGQERYAKRLKVASQEIQRQLGELNAERKRHNLQQLGIDHFLHDVMLERLPKEQVALIFSEAIRRKRQYDNDCELQEQAIASHTEAETKAAQIQRRKKIEADLKFEQDFNRLLKEQSDEMRDR